MIHSLPLLQQLDSSNLKGLYMELYFGENNFMIDLNLTESVVFFVCLFVFSLSGLANVFIDMAYLVMQWKL